MQACNTSAAMVTAAEHHDTAMLWMRFAIQPQHHGAWCHTMPGWQTHHPVNCNSLSSSAWGLCTLQDCSVHDAVLFNNAGSAHLRLNPQFLQEHAPAMSPAIGLQASCSATCSSSSSPRQLAYKLHCVYHPCHTVCLHLLGCLNQQSVPGIGYACTWTSAIGCQKQPKTLNALAAVQD